MKEQELPNCPSCDKNINVEYMGGCAYYCDTIGCPDTWFVPGVPEPSNASFREIFEATFPSLDYEYICLMDEIGKLGRDKYGDKAVENRAKRGDFARNPRIYTREIANHAANHFQEYIDGVRHDVYGTRKHQLAAASFNPMMEFILSREQN